MTDAFEHKRGHSWIVTVSSGNCSQCINVLTCCWEQVLEKECTRAALRFICSTSFLECEAVVLNPSVPESSNVGKVVLVDSWSNEFYHYCNILLSYYRRITWYLHTANSAALYVPPCQQTCLDFANACKQTLADAGQPPPPCEVCENPRTTQALVLNISFIA